MVVNGLYGGVWLMAEISLDGGCTHMEFWGDFCCRLFFREWVLTERIWCYKGLCGLWDCCGCLWMTDVEWLRGWYGVVTYWKYYFNLVLWVKIFLVLGGNLQVEWCSLIISSKKIQGNDDIIKEGVIKCVISFGPFVLF